jgi:hypothetical protein
MLRIGLMIALILAANPADAADPSAARNCDQAGANATEPPARERCTPEPQGGAPQSYILLPAPDPLGDITDARGPNPHARLMAQYAVYASIGNRDGMQFISDQLREFGVTREELADFADHAKLHTGSPREPSRTVSQMEQAWKLSQ